MRLLPLAVLALLLAACANQQPLRVAPHGIKTDPAEPSECLNGEVLELGRCVPQGTEEGLDPSDASRGVTP